MPILGAELLYYRPQTVSDGASNGGRMSASQIASGAVGAIFPAVGESERTAGSTKYRKVFAKNANADGLALSFPKIFLDKYTPGDDRITFQAATQTNTQSQIDGGAKKYGAGKLDANVIAGATDMDVLVEDGTDHTFEDGDEIRISDLFNLADLSGTEEFVTIVGTPSVAGDVITFTFTPALANGYAASDSRVMNVYEPAGDVVASLDYFFVDSSLGTFDADNALPDNVGSVEQQWTCTFTGATTFNIVGDKLGAVGSGSIGAGAAPNNPDFGAPYFTLEAAGFGGTFVASDTIQFGTSPAAVPLFLERVVPAGAAALSPNSALLQFRGETA